MRTRLTYLLAALSLLACHPQSDPAPSSSDGYNGLRLTRVGVGEATVLLTDADAPAPRDLLIDYWYYDLTEDEGEAMADAQTLADDPDESFVVRVAQRGQTNYDRQRRAVLAFDPGSLIVLHVRGLDGMGGWCTVNTTGDNVPVTLSLKAGGRIKTAPSRGKLTFQVMQEGDVMRNPGAGWTLYQSETELPHDPNQRLTYLQTHKPTYSVRQPANARSYTRKTVKPGWYYARYNDSDVLIHRFQVGAGEDVLLNMDDNSGFGGGFTGVWPDYGKLKVSLWNGPQKPKSVTVSLTAARTIDFVLFAEDGTGAKKGVCWYMPTNGYRYSSTYNDVTKSGQIAVAPGKTYPHVKLAF